MADEKLLKRRLSKSMEDLLPQNDAMEAIERLRQMQPADCCANSPGRKGPRYDAESVAYGSRSFVNLLSLRDEYAGYGEEMAASFTTSRRREPLSASPPAATAVEHVYPQRYGVRFVVDDGDGVSGPETKPDAYSTTVPSAYRPKLVRSSTAEDTLWRDRFGYSPSPEPPRTPDVTSESLPAWRFRELLSEARKAPDVLGRAENGVRMRSPGALEEMEEEESGVPECPLCMEEYLDEGPQVPRNLHCGHTFCTGCLSKIYLRDPSDLLSCPTCNKETPIPTKSVDSLPKNYGLLEIIPGSVPSGTCVQSDKQWSPKAMRSRKISSRRKKPGQGTEALLCPEHGDHLSSYCVNDDVLVCSSCLLYGAHKNHNCQLVNTAARAKREKLAQLSPDVLAHKKKMIEALAQVEKERKAVVEGETELLSEVEKQFGDLVHAIERRRDELKMDIMHRTQTRVEALNSQASDLHDSVEKAAVAHHSCSNLLRSDDFALIKGSALVLEQIEGVFINTPRLVPRARGDLRFSFSPELKDDVLSNIGGLGKAYSEPGSISHIFAHPYHDGIRVFWEGHDLADNHGMTYHLQKAAEGTDLGEYVMLYRGGNTKFTWKADLEEKVTYRFRVQVRTREGVGSWSKPVEVYRAPPVFRWHDGWCNVHIELSPNKMEATWRKGSANKYWATFAGSQFLERGQHYFEVEIVELGRPKPSKKLAIGLIGTSKPKVKSVPWQDGKHAIGQWNDLPSWAFHPISGDINSKDLPQDGKHYADIKMQTGDRIGVLVDMDGKKLSFFCNGQDLGVAFKNIEADSVLPAVSIRDKLSVRLRFPPPPFSNRKPRLIRLGIPSFS